VSAVRQPAESEHSGRLLLRMPRALHGELAQAAEREGVSLNRLIVARLSGSPVGAPRASAEPQRARSRLLDYALAANVAVLLVTGIAAIVLLVTAYR